MFGKVGIELELDNFKPKMETVSKTKGLAEQSPAYEILQGAGVLCTDYRREDIADIFTGKDYKANSTKQKNLEKQMLSCLSGTCFFYNFTK